MRKQCVMPCFSVNIFYIYIIVCLFKCEIEMTKGGRMCTFRDKVVDDDNKVVAWC